MTVLTRDSVVHCGVSRWSSRIQTLTIEMSAIARHVVISLMPRSLPSPAFRFPNRKAGASLCLPPERVATSRYEEGRDNEHCRDDDREEHVVRALRAKRSALPF